MTGIVHVVNEHKDVVFILEEINTSDELLTVKEVKQACFVNDQLAQAWLSFNQFYLLQGKLFTVTLALGQENVALATPAE